MSSPGAGVRLNVLTFELLGSDAFGVAPEPVKALVQVRLVT